MSTDPKGATMTTDHRKREAQAAQGVLIDDADFLREIVQRVLQEVLEAEMTEHLGAAPTNAPRPEKAIATDTSREL
jgi:transposase-like protein